MNLKMTQARILANAIIERITDAAKAVALELVGSTSFIVASAPVQLLY